MRTLADLLGGPVTEYVDAKPTPRCDYCHDTHYVDNGRGIVWCPRCSTEQARVAEERATGLIGELRAYSLDTFVAANTGSYHARAIAGALDAARQAVSHPYGMVGWYGGVGTGKTHLLAGVCNALRRRDLAVHYTTTVALLDHLRDAFNPKQDGGEAYSRRFERMLAVDVLALDELDRFNTTPWATSAFFRLIDHRYSRANECLTLWATNKRLVDREGRRQSVIGDDTGYLESRLSDGRFLAVDMGEGDVRASLDRASWLARVEIEAGR